MHYINEYLLNRLAHCSHETFTVSFSQSTGTLRTSELIESVAAEVKFRSENLFQDLIQMAIKEANGKMHCASGQNKALQVIY